MSEDKMVIRGKMALKLDGIVFAKNQLAAGIDAFAPLLASDELTNQWNEESIVYENELDEDEDENVQSDSDDDDDEVVYEDHDNCE